MKIVSTIPFDPVQKTYRQQCFQVNKKLFCYKWEELRGHKVHIVSKADCPLEKTRHKEHLAIECTVQLLKPLPFCSPLLPAFLSIDTNFLGSTAIFTVKTQFLQDPCQNELASFFTRNLQHTRPQKSMS